MTSQQPTILKEISPLCDSDCFYIVERHKSVFTYPLHTHLVFELNYIENAEGVQRIVGDSVEAISNQELVLITGKELEHAWLQGNCKSTAIREITIQFSSELFSMCFIDKNQFQSIRRMFDQARKGLVFSKETILSIKQKLHLLLNTNQGFNSFIEFIKILYELSISANTRTLSSSSFAKAEIKSESRRVRKLQDYIATNYTQEIRLAHLAEILNMSEVASSRFFKQQTGKNIVDYIVETRLGACSRLLVDTEDSITDICYNTGFNNISNFNRAFKKVKGCTPKEFRENYRKKRIII